MVFSMPLPPHFLPDPFSVLPKAAAIEKILHAAMSPADAEVAVHTHVRVSGSVMVVGNTTYNLDEYQRVLVLGIGNASIAMARAVLNLLGSRVTEGLIVTKHADLDRIGPIKVIESSHPVPDERSLAAAQRLTSLLKSTTDNDLVVFVISGGGSALMSHPKSSISLGDLQALTRILLQSGADIREMNVLRRHLDLVKGGGLLGMGIFGSGCR
jgi:glycerate-2-kinase